MVLRPADSGGDILPVLSSSDLLRGAPAAARLVRDRLELLAGEWWENPEQGNQILEMLKSARMTETDARAAARYITSYIRQTAGVLEVEDVSFSAEGRWFSLSCRADTEDGSAQIDYSFGGG